MGDSDLDKWIPMKCVFGLSQEDNQGLHVLRAALITHTQVNTGNHPLITILNEEYDIPLCTFKSLIRTR